LVASGIGSVPQALLPMLDLAIVLAFVVYAITAGFRARRKASENLEEYFLAGKQIKGWRAGLSMAATQFAADTPLLVTGLIATGGIFLLWRLWIYGLAFILMGFVFAIGWRRAAVLTDAELTEIRYSGRGVLSLRVLKAIYYGTVINCVVMAMVLVAAVRIAEVFLPWHEWLPAGLYAGIVSIIEGTGLVIGGSVLGLSPEMATTNNLISILLILVFTALYATTGGLRSVISTDILQFALAMIGTAVYAWIVVQAAGGLGGLSDRVIELYGPEEAGRMLSFSPEMSGEMLMPFLMIIGMQWLFQMNSDGTGYLAQRSMACETDRDARMAGVIFAWMQILIRSLIWLVIGVGLLVLYPFALEDATAEGFTASREILFVTGVDELLPIGIRGLMLTGLLAALASTIDTHLNWGASYWSNDVYKRLVCNKWLRREPSSRELVVSARLSNVLILTIALIIMANLGSIQEAWITSLLLGAGMGSVLVLRWLWERINLYSELAAILVSLITAYLLLFVFRMGEDQDWLRLAIMAGVSTAAAIGVTYFTPPTDQRMLDSFYRRVNPMGFWGRTAASVGHTPASPRAALWLRLRFTLFCAASLFLLLVGLGRLLIATPEVNQLWSWVMVISGLAITPLWWKAAFVDEEIRVERSRESHQVGRR
jgi:solute:Na+ symporter, SSS family